MLYLNKEIYIMLTYYESLKMAMFNTVRVFDVVWCESTTVQSRIIVIIPKV